MPTRVMGTLESSTTVRSRAEAIGVSFTGETVMETVAGPEDREPSEAVKVKESAPL